MKCEFCGEEYQLSQLTFVEAGRVPGIAMVRRRAQCRECREMPAEVKTPEVTTDDAPF